MAWVGVGIRMCCFLHKKKIKSHLGGEERQGWRRERDAEKITMRSVKTLLILCSKRLREVAPLQNGLGELELNWESRG